MINKLFLEHPQSVEETYFEHFLFALGFSFSLFGAAFAAMAHAFIPVACEKNSQ